MGRGRARAGGFGKHRKGRTPKGTQPKPAHWKEAQRRQAEAEHQAMQIAAVAYQLSVNLAGKFNGDMMALVDQVTRERGEKRPAVIARAKAIMEETLAEARAKSQAELKEAKRGQEA